ncbi:CCA tRNA nucleotidyltransferase [Tepidimicrobium xylanilyticum]|uniref:tRNA nucleotidyltransferase (CCA-adding enzyme) n=1 Tax=Tepidimicrobium xylanilyticum TaxID=1123352 RepID=A0A1H2VBD5_9FIRM|nr:HD domain-containing protein [Tepidimicrobium xylanilyticum]SDW65635.1 tRNA nucleotidyltransferase (CCA-adding enzyme) [Tepidimicrobium xylanilyticum]
MQFNIPDYVEKILEKLEKEGYQAYVVGGSIRDMLLGKNPKDYDITTDAKPFELEDIFSDFKTISVGKEFGTIIVCQEEGNVEITTFRQEGNYLDGRRPEWVTFSRKVEDDLSRRDFTINAMAYNKKVGIIDPYGGREDLKNRIIRTVGNPEKRFSEDYLRILRAIRFATELKFTIDKPTFYAGRKCSSKISNVSMERISDEFFKILLSKKPSNGIRMMEEMGILEMVLPELIPTIGFDQRNPNHNMDVYNHILCVLDNTPPIIQTRLAALFHDIGKPSSLTIDERGIGHFYGHDQIGAQTSKMVLERFKASNDLRDKVYLLVKEHMNHHADFKEKGLKRLIRRMGEKEIFDLIDLQIADIKCSNEKATIDHIVERRKRIEEILEKEEAYEIRQLAINGRDLLDLGFKQGPIIGQVLEYLLDRVMDKPELNEKDTLKKLALDYIDKK